MIYFGMQYDSIEIPKQREQQEAVLQEIRTALKQPRAVSLIMRGDDRMTPITPAQLPPQVTRAEVLPFRKKQPPKPTEPPDEPYRQAAQLGDLLRKQLR